MKIRSFFCLAAVVGGGAAGCAHAASIQISNPLVSGNVPQNSIDFPNYHIEAGYGLATGTLTHKASLATLDKERVCFNVALKTTGERRDLADLKGWRVFLRGEPEFEDMSPQISDEMEQAETQMQGTVQREKVENQRICDENGQNCFTNQITTTYTEPTMVTIVSGGGTVCFGNVGHISTKTEQITLHLDDPKPNFVTGGMFASMQNRVAFRWDFTP